MDLAPFRMLNNELMNNFSGVVPYKAPIIILDIKSEVCSTNNGSETKHTRHISRKMKLVRNGEE